VPRSLSGATWFPCKPAELAPFYPGANKTLERQNVFHYRRDQVPEMLLLAIEEYSEKRVREAFDRAGTSLFEALEKPGLIQ
jgi:hypothetical protein